MSKTTFTYHANDGYVTGDRPLRVTIDDGDLQACDSLEEAYNLVADIIEDDFRQRVTPGWKEATMRELIGKARNSP